MKRLIGCLVAVIVFFAASHASAQGFWDKKEWKKWSADDCKKMLQDSPWARRWAQTTNKMAEFSSYNRATGQGTGGGGTADESKLEVYYVVQLRSAQPVREAIARQAQIQYKYDSLDEKGRASLDQQTDKIVNANFEDIVVVHVYYGANVPQYERTLASIWQNYPSGTVPQEAFLDLSSGKKVPPLKMVSPRTGQNEFEFIFPRIVDGEPIVSANSKVLGVEFYSPTVGEVPGDRVHIEFKPEKMKFNGVIAY